MPRLHARESIALLIRSERQRHGLTTAEVARLTRERTGLGVSQPNVVNAEGNLTKRYDWARRAIAEALTGKKWVYDVWFSQES